MDQKLTITDIEYIYNLAGHKTDEELAVIIKKPVGLIQMLFSIMAGLPKRPWEQGPIIDPSIIATPKVENKPVKKERVKAVRKQKKVVKKKDKKLSPHAAEMEQLKIRKDRLRRGTYKTRPIDLTGKVAMKLNAKTTVWAKPGTDIAELKKKYNIA